MGRTESKMSDDIFGNYEIIRRLSTGGMGEILLARQKGVAGSERTVIIKMILAHLAGDPEFVDRFTDESRIAACLNHGNIVQVFESGCWEGRFYMVMEHVDGLDLKEILKRNPQRIPPEKWLPFYIHVLSETAKALTYAYNKKDEKGQPMMVVHRDVSPSNILVSREGLVKLTDFGVAKATMRTSVTLPGRLHGKVNYMAPEQVRGLECDHRSDVFSLGVVGYEMLAGFRPFEGDSDVAVLEKIRSMNMRPLAEAATAIPPELAAIVSRAIAAEPDSRWQTAEEFSAALLGWAHANGISLMTSGIAAMLAHNFGPEPAMTGSGLSLDQYLEDAVDEMLRTPSAAIMRERTGTVSRPVQVQAAPPAVRHRWPLVAAISAGIVTAAIGAVIFLNPGTEVAVTPDARTGIDATRVVTTGAAGTGADAGVGSMAASTGNATGQGNPTAAADMARDNAAAAGSNSIAGTDSTTVDSPTAGSATTGPTIPPDAGLEPRGRKAPRSVALNGNGRQPPTHSAAQQPGRVVFRFFPADSLVAMDGHRVAVDGNLVEMDIAPGNHVLSIQSNKGDNTTARSFNIEPGKTLPLGTIELADEPGQGQ